MLDQATLHLTPGKIPEEGRSNHNRRRRQESYAEVTSHTPSVYDKNILSSFHYLLQLGNPIARYLFHVYVGNPNLLNCAVKNDWLLSSVSYGVTSIVTGSHVPW
ncbi:hypothetical protein Plhal304r1_c025g0084151 [Plasmopara halstedii]